jgi:hypothetical protein
MSRRPDDKTQHRPGHGRLSTRWCLTLCCVLLCAWTTGGGQLEAKAPDAGQDWLKNELHLNILIRALAYDRKLDRNADASTIRIGVLFDPLVDASHDAGAYVTGLLEERARTRTLKNRKIIIVGIPLAGDDERPERALPTGVSAIYLTPHLKREAIERLLKVTRELDIMTFTGVEDYVRDGVALGVTLRGSSPKLLINLRGARAEGSEFSSKILKLAEILDRDDS